MKQTNLANELVQTKLCLAIPVLLRDADWQSSIESKPYSVLNKYVIYLNWIFILYFWFSYDNFLSEIHKSWK